MSPHQQFQQLIENLISLKNHYQTLLSEYEHKAVRAREQLTHVNALLLAQLTENQPAVQSLIDLRSHYQTLHEQQQQKSVHAREQITHLNALLADQFVWQTQQPVSIAASTLEAQALFGTAELKNEEFSQQVPDAKIEAHTSPPLQKQQVAESEEPETPNESNEDSNQPASTSKTPLLPKYQKLTKIQAVEQLLQENQGSILHVDYIINQLYGISDAEAIKAEKPRMYDTLGQGTDKGLWDKVPDQPSCYTIDIDLVQPEKTQTQPVGTKKASLPTSTASRRRPSSRSRSSEEMLPRFQRMSLTAAVETVVQEHPGEVLTTEKVAKALHGEDIDGRALTKAKDRIGKILWGGATQNRWQRVPGKLGCYTLDLKQLQ